MKYRIQCDTCDWTLTDPNSVRVYAGQEELFSRLIPGETDAIAAARSEVFNLDPDGSDEAILHAFRLSGEQVERNAIWRLVCAECGHGLNEANTVTYEVEDLLRTAKVMQGQVAEFPRCEEWLERVIVALDDLSRVPKFVITPEVELLLRDLRGMKDGESDGLGELCQRAIDAITLLSAKAPLSSGQEVLKRMQQDLPGIIEKQLREEMRAAGPESSEDDLIGDLRHLITFQGRQVAFLSAKKVVRGTIRDGVLELTEVSEGVEVDIRDYDVIAKMRSGKHVHLHDPELLKTDEDGNQYFQTGS